MFSAQNRPKNAQKGGIRSMSNGKKEHFGAALRQLGAEKRWS